MQESTQRSLCRLGFFVSALLPTLLTFAWCLWHILPFSQMLACSTWESHLSGVLGVSVHIDRVHVVAPYRYRMQGVQLTHPETGQMIFDVDNVDLIENKDFGRNSWTLLLNNGRLSVEPLRYQVVQMHERWLCQPQRNFPRIHCIGENLSVLEGNKLLLESVHWESQFSCKKEQSILECALSWNPDSSSAPHTAKQVKSVEEIAKPIPVTIVATRQHLLSEPMTTWRVRTADFAIPTEIVSSLYGHPLSLGVSSTIQGNLEAQQTRNDWCVFLERVQVSGIKWEQITAALPFKLLGAGDIAIQNTYILNGQIQQADAIVQGQSGSISRAWLAASQDDIATRIVPDVISGAIAMVPFDAMKARLIMDTAGLTIAGAIPDMQGYMNSMFADGRGGIVYEPSEPKVSWESVKRWLTRDPFASTDFEMNAAPTTAENVLNPVQQASHHVNGHPPSQIARWLNTVLPNSGPTTLRR